MSKKTSFLSALLLATFVASAFSQIPAHNWSHRFGDVGEDYGRAIATDGSGNLVMTGWILGNVDFGGGVLAGGATLIDADVYLLRLDANGNHLFSARFGDDALDQTAMAIAVGSEGSSYITGSMFGSADFGGGTLTSAGMTDVFIARHNAAGAHRWSKVIGGVGLDDGLGIAANGDAVYVTGAFTNTVDFGGGPLVSAGDADVFVARYDTAGAHQWSQRFGDNLAETARTVAVAPDGGVVIGGLFQGAINFGGGALNAVGANDVFVAKFNAAGVHQWSKRFGNDNADLAGVAVDGSGNVLITGLFTGSIDFGGGALTSGGSTDAFLAKLDPSGSHIWSKGFGDTEQQTGSSVAVDADRNVLATGLFRGSMDLGGGALTSAGSFDAYVAMYDSLGNHVGSQRYGDTVWDEGMGVAFDEVGNAFLCGAFSGTVDFGGGGLTSADVEDAFIVKFGDIPTAVAITSFVARPVANGVEFTGYFSSDLSVQSVNVYRSDAPDAPLLLHDTVAYNSTASRDEAFVYRDERVEPGHTYLYQLGVVDGDGEFYSQVLSVTTKRFETALLGNVPNPFNPSTTIRFTLDAAQPVTISIYDVGGRLVANLLDEVRAAGLNEVTWDGRDRQGDAVGSGVYFCRMRAGANVESRRMVLLK